MTPSQHARSSRDENMNSELPDGLQSLQLTTPRPAHARRGTVLVADDEPGMRLALREALTRSGWVVEAVESGEAALARLQAGAPADLLLSDCRMGGMSGLELLRAAKKLRPQLPAILMTAYATVEDAIAALKDGAGDYLLKPFSLDDVLRAVERAVGPGGPSAPVAAARTLPKATDAIATSPAMRALFQIAAEIAPAEATVLLSGESGTGKEVLARFIHRRSGRRGAFVAINCAALPEGLLESELFGHEKGAFTGAILARKGRFEQADGGTLLLDEISEMPLALQAKLLRVIQEKEIVPVGGSEPLRLDVRIIATTNRQLEQAVANGEFRQDLYYRLNVIGLPLPPLRERAEDLEPLTEFFLNKYRRPDRPPRRLAPETLPWLRAQRWPGNVRELENMIERACLLARGELITPADLRLDLTGAIRPAAEAPIAPAAPLPEAPGQPATLEEMERRMILQTLERTGGNRTRTADLLGVSVRTIRNKIHQYGLHELAGA